MSTPAIAIFDIGKTNKKLFLFDEQYHKVYEESIQLKETVDEDGDACEDLLLLTKWVKDSFVAIMNKKAFKEIGKMTELGPLETVKLMWALDAIDKGYRFKAIANCKIC